MSTELLERAPETLKSEQYTRFYSDDLPMNPVDQRRSNIVNDEISNMRKKVGEALSESGIFRRVAIIPEIAELAIRGKIKGVRDIY